MDKSGVGCYFTELEKLGFLVMFTHVTNPQGHASFAIGNHVCGSLSVFFSIARCS